MPLKLQAPKAGRSPYWRIRGTYMRVYVDRSTGSTDRRIASKELAKIKDQIERGAFAKDEGPTFASALVSYIQSGGEARFLTPLLEYWRETPLARIDQAAIDACAAALYPNATQATRNRQVYTPMIAIFRRAQIQRAIHRPVGANGKARTDYLTPDQAARLIEAAEAINPRFGALLTFLLLTGSRLSEGLNLQWSDVSLQDRTALARKTKNGKPRLAYLPPALVASMAALEARTGKVFGYSKSGRLYALLSRAEEAAGVIIPPGVAFHIFRHTYGTWMKSTGADLQKIGAWASNEHRRYDHTLVTEAARMADLLPFARVKSVRRVAK